MCLGGCAHDVVQVFVYIAFASASLLIVFRTYVFHTPRSSCRSKALMVAARIAIWNRNRIVVMISVGVWLTNVAFMIHSKSAILYVQ